MKKKNNLSFTVICISLFLLFFTACVPQKKIKYLQSPIEEKIENTDTKSFKNDRDLSYKIQSGDNLYIKVSSLDQKTSQLFDNNNNNNNNVLNSEMGVYLNSYTVDDNGNINLPVIKQVNVKGLTIKEVRNTLQKIVNEYIVEATVFVKMVNFNVTLLGEVRRPGKYKIYQDRINIFEAIGMGNDLTDFADRKRIKLIRQTKTGYDIHYIDMTKNDLLESKYYYLMPNDIVYAEPLKVKQFGFSTFPYSIIFSTISATLLILNYMK